MSALLLALVALVLAAAVAVRAHLYAADRRDAAWADDWITQLRAMRGAAHWPAGDDDLEDRAAQAEALTADELGQRRLARCVRDHPAGKGR
jgi:hypothetical protein